MQLLNRYIFFIESKQACLLCAFRITHDRHQIRYSIYNSLSYVGVKICLLSLAVKTNKILSRYSKAGVDVKHLGLVVQILDA